MNRTIVITGASDGLGAAAGRLTRSGENVVVVRRSPTKTAAAATSSGADYFVTDFADLAQVRELAAQLLERCPRIDVLANNAGVTMGARREVTADGHETTFQVNHLAPFLLTTLLLDRLIDSRASVLNTSSLANRFAAINFDDLDASAKYRAPVAYARSKLMNILFTKELHRRYHDAGIATAAFHPGPGSIQLQRRLRPQVLRVDLPDPIEEPRTDQPGSRYRPTGLAGIGHPARTGFRVSTTRNTRPAEPTSRHNPALAEQLWERNLDMIATQHRRDTT